MWDVPLSELTVEYASVRAFFWPWAVDNGTLISLPAQRSSILTGVYMIAAMFIKASILFLYRRLFKVSMTASIMIWIGLSVDVIFYLTTFIAFMVGCIPRREDDQYGGWLSLTFAQRCNNVSTPTAAATGIVGSVLDVYILIIPLIMVSGLRASWKKKAGIFAIFIAGSSYVAPDTPTTDTIWKLSLTPAPASSPSSAPHTA